MSRPTAPGLIAPFLALALTGTPALAQTQGAMNAAAAQKAKAADAALNQAYVALMRKSGTRGKALLRRAQRQWIAFRDAECNYEASGVAGGSAQPMVYSGCVERVTRDRTAQLRKMAQCEEGDLSCPA